MPTELNVKQPRTSGISAISDVRGPTDFHCSTRTKHLFNYFRIGCNEAGCSRDRSRDADVFTLDLPIWRLGPRLVLLMVGLLFDGAGARAAVETQQTIRVVMDNAYAPYSFLSERGELQGILIDQWKLWEKKTGITVEISAMDWAEAVRRMRAGEFDVIDCIVETPERREYFDFTPAYATIETPIFFRKDISGITDLASLKGFAVGVKTGDQHIDQLKENGLTSLILFQNNEAIIKAARQHKINVFVADEPSAFYLLNKAGIDADFRDSAPIFREELRRGVRKGNATLLRAVVNGFAAINPGELKQINEKWFGRTINRIRHFFAYAGYAAAAALLVITGLTVWNRALRNKVMQRTAALRESELRFRRLVELMPVAVYVCDITGRIQSYNQHAVELWGREPKPGDTAQRYCGSLRLYSTEGKLVPHEESVMAEVLKTGVRARDLEVIIERPDGSRITVLVNIAPLRNSQGQLIGAMNCFQDISERKHAEEALKHSHDKLRALTARLESLREDERMRISREIHDELGQKLTGLKMDLLRAERKLDGLEGSPAVNSLLDTLVNATELADSITSSVQEIAANLRPGVLDKLGLGTALQYEARRFQERTGILCKVHLPENEQNLSAQVSTTLFRIFQECLTNIARHARATKVEVVLNLENEWVTLRVDDNGRGITEAEITNSASLGLLGMKERTELLGGEILFQHDAQGGTVVIVRIPESDRVFELKELV